MAVIHLENLSAEYRQKLRAGTLTRETIDQLARSISAKCQLRKRVFRRVAVLLPAGTVLIEQPTAVADALERYFAQHPEYDLGDSGRRDFLTTGQAGPQSELVSQFWGAPLAFDPA